MQNMIADDKFIDVEKVIAGKNPRLLKLLPRFVISYLKRILHQDQMNDFIARHRDKKGIDFVDAALNHFKANISVNGSEHVDPKRNYVVVANHPLGGLDGMALMKVLSSINPNIAMTANDFLMHVKNLEVLFVPVNKHGSNADNIAILNETFASDKVIMFFPAGLCSRKTNGQIIDLEWKKTFLSHARKYGRDILPVHISGRNSSFFYNLANLRKKLGIKANLEMLYLVDEMFRQADKNIVITFGHPIPVGLFDKKLKDKDWAARLRKFVYRLEDDPEARFELTND